MRKQTLPVLVVLLLVFASRLVPMITLPMSDTTEPRYAHITWLMLERGDWITPWFTETQPFWGKPPLSFWLQALSAKLIGLSDFALRLPSWLAVIGIVLLTVSLARQYGGRTLAHRSGIILATMALTYVSAGAVMTDAVLAFGTTLSLVSFALVLEGRRGLWPWLFFVGLVVGLLAKGPLTLVLVGLPIAAWTVWSERRAALPTLLPWLRGFLLVAACTLPWYVAAELKTPGFLDYFIVGEHFRRFIDSGWVGDLYGQAHEEPRGMIWLYLLGASAPWGPLGLVLILAQAWRRDARPRSLLADRRLQLLLPAALAPAVFFTLSGNILWTYVLPGLPFLAIVLAIGLPTRGERFGAARLAIAMAVPLAFVGTAAYFSLQPQLLRSEITLVKHFQELPDAAEQQLYYLGRIPFSARYYSRGAAQAVERETLPELIATNQQQTLYLAVRRREVAAVSQALAVPVTTRFEGTKYTLLQLGGPSPGSREKRGI